MDMIKFKAEAGVNSKSVQDLVDALSLSVALDNIEIESNTVFDIITSDPAGFTQADRDAIISAVEALGAWSFETYVQMREAEFNEKTKELIHLGYTHNSKHYNLDIISQHNADAVGGHFSDNVIERAVSQGEDLATAYSIILAASYPVRISTSDGGYTEFTNHTDYMVFKNALLARIKSVSEGGQDLRDQAKDLIANDYGNFAAVDAIVDNRV